MPETVVALLASTNTLKTDHPPLNPVREDKGTPLTTHTASWACPAGKNSGPATGKPLEALYGDERVEQADWMTPPVETGWRAAGQCCWPRTHRPSWWLLARLPAGGG